MKLKQPLLVLFVAFFFFSLGGVWADERYLHVGRGNPWEYDPGPQKDSEWLKIFARTPNYRGIGKAIFGFDRFRWHWGPVLYRGRLGENEARVLIIGQEGAQDEALSTRAFTGGTGQKMQHFLNHIGINRSYLFFNTFVYCIFGQYRDSEMEFAPEGDLWMAQSPNSPIVQHRHELFNHALETNDLRLIIAVGAAAKDTLVTWIESRGGSCENKSDVQSCDTAVLGDKIHVLSVPHPGGAGQVDTEEEREEVLEKLRRKFQDATNLVAEWIYEDPSWLPKDETAQRSKIVENEDETFRFSEAFRYRSAPVPYSDFPFGFNWRLGKRGTSSNRGDGQRSVKIFSDKGEYADTTVKWRTPTGSSKETSGYIDVKGDLPYESPRQDPNAFDPGPGTEWATLLMGGEAGLEWPDFNELGVTTDISFGRGALYRGRFNEARILIVADQESHDDMFTGRALSGDGGQKVQHFLKKLGITKSYLIIRTLPVNTLDLNDEKVVKIANHPQVLKIQKEILERILFSSRQNTPTELILTFGPHAKSTVEKIDTRDLPVFNLKSPSEPTAYKNWNKILKTISKIKYTTDIKPNFREPYDKHRFKETRLEINRYDLPIQTKRWVGTSGSLATRALNNPEHYKLTMPLWADRLKPNKLSKSELFGLKLDGWLRE